MKQALLLHGLGGNPQENWFPWLKNKLEDSGYDVSVPQLPDAERPSHAKWGGTVMNLDADFGGGMIVGHSSGATEVLNLLLADEFPQVETAVVVGTFLNEKLTKDAEWHEPGQFADLFVKDFDPAKLQAKANNWYFVHSPDDPYCDYDDAKNLCKQLGGTFISVPNGGHLSESSGVTELPQLLEALQADDVL